MSGYSVMWHPAKNWDPLIDYILHDTWSTVTGPTEIFWEGRRPDVNIIYSTSANPDPQDRHNYIAFHDPIRLAGMRLSYQQAGGVGTGIFRVQWADTDTPETEWQETTGEWTSINQAGFHQYEVTWNPVGAHRFWRIISRNSDGRQIQLRSNVDSDSWPQLATYAIAGDLLLLSGTKIL